MNLIIVAPLVKPPTETLPLRFVTLVSKTELAIDVLVEVEQRMKDKYYKYMAKRGLMDYVAEFVTPIENEAGIRLDTKLNFPLTIQVKAIQFSNLTNVLGQVKCLAGI
jgi:hypothetical protein